MGFGSIDDSEFAALQKHREELCERFGQAFKEGYGWAAVALNNNKPNFSDIEKFVELDHVRPFYRMASHSIHANPKSVVFDMGLLGCSEVMLAGPSNAGLLDPAQNAAISIVDITVTLLTLRPTYTNQVSILVLLRLRDDIIDAFSRAHDQLEQEHEEIIGEPTVDN